MNVEGIEATIAALSERFGPEHDALLALARSLAQAVDDKPGDSGLWREYRAVVSALSEVGADDADDDTASFLVSVTTPGRAKVGNPPKP
ncbi:MAG TPA: hypothetical protein VMZ73_09125 [Acidimicrobiales bacterium]|nr:hypothetical protein [Acidimicrobiales bacterium]